MLPAKSKIEELKAEIAIIANAPKALKQEAIAFAARVVGCYPGHQWGDELLAKIYAEQLTEALVGVDLDILHDLVSAKHGIATKCRKLPTILEVTEYIDYRYEPRRRDIGIYLEEIKRLEGVKQLQPLTADERIARAEMLKKLSQTIRDTAYEIRRKTGKLISPTYCDDPEGKLKLAALANLEESRNGGVLPDLD